jgi:transposase InsO family protein
LTGLARSTYYRIVGGYRHYKPVQDPIPQSQRYQPAALATEEQEAVLEILNREDYSDLSVQQTYWRGLDNQEIGCSPRTVYRIAQRHGLVGDRRRGHHSSPGTNTRSRPVIHATGPGQLWSWDITDLHGPTNDDRYKLYLAVDVFSRYPVCWRIEHTENKPDAIDMFTTAITEHGPPTVLHSDNGAVMRSHKLIKALDKRGVINSRSRPRVSNDNPFSESLFKTIKYDLSCPEKFDSIEHARAWTEQFLHDYATEHRHSGLNHYTPEQVHTGTADDVADQRHQHRLDNYNKHPERFRKPPKRQAPPTIAGINIKPAKPREEPALS